MAGSPYTITCAPGTLSAPNYSFATGTTASLTFTKATLPSPPMTRPRSTATPTRPSPPPITGFKNGETLATSGVTGSPDLDHVCHADEPRERQPLRDHGALGTLAAGNYAFTFVAGHLTRHQGDAHRHRR